MPTFLLTAVIVAVAVAGQTSANDVVDDPEAYAVYAAVLATGWPRTDLPRTTVALEGKTSAHVPCPAWNRSLGPEWQPVIDSYARENAAVRTLLPTFNLTVPYVLITSAEYEALLMEAAGDMKQIYSPFWGAMSVSVSAVGFNATKARAMVTLQYLCQSGCQGGTHFLMEKQGGRWSVTKADIVTCLWGS